MIKEAIRKFFYLSPVHSIPSNIRMAHDYELMNQIGLLIKKKKSLGVMLDAGSKDSPYRNRIVCEKFMTLDIDPNSNPDICSDVHKIKGYSNFFDTVLATNLLEHTQEPAKVIKEFRRILKKGGICIVSTPFIYAYHPDPRDFYRLTPDSYKSLFKDFSEVKIVGYGNRIQCIWHLVTFGKLMHLLFWFNPLISRVRYNDKKFPSGYIVIAKK